AYSKERSRNLLRMPAKVDNQFSGISAHRNQLGWTSTHSFERGWKKMTIPKRGTAGRPNSNTSNRRAAGWIDNRRKRNRNSSNAKISFVTCNGSPTNNGTRLNHTQENAVSRSW